jgi:DNA-directed RNA polymerase specialized sigma24 family protein
MIVRKNRNSRHAHDGLRITIETDLHHRGKSRTPEQMLVQARLADALEKGVAGLKPTLRGPISDYLREGTKLEELSHRHGLTLGATKIRIHRAKLSLREQLRAHLEPGRPVKRNKREAKGTECSP